MLCRRDRTFDVKAEKTSKETDKKGTHAPLFFIAVLEEVLCLGMPGFSRLASNVMEERNRSVRETFGQ